MTNTVSKSLVADPIASTTNPNSGILAALLSKDKAIEAKEEHFHHYISARVAPRLATEKGHKIRFTDHRHLTQNEEVIEYLDREIKAHNLPGITIEEIVSTSDIDPQASLRKRARKELLKELQAEAAGGGVGSENRDMGSFEPPGLNPTNSKQTAS